jgi:hypothetical protein
VYRDWKALSMPSPHSINFPDDPDPLARYRREAEQQEEEFARQRRLEEREQQRTQQTMDPAVQERWDRWADGRIAAAWRNSYCEVVGEALGETRKEIRKQHDDDIAALRREITELRNSPPPLIAPPDRRLASALQKVGEELHAIREGVEAARGDVAERVKRTDLGVLRQRLENRIAELEERNETAEKNSRAAISMVFNVSNALERVHALLARLAVATDNEHVLTAVDKLHLADEEKPSAATVLSLADLRYARSA